MFSGIEITNYKCFKHCAVPLKPLTVLIGKNNSGKSTFLDALTVMRNRRKLTENAEGNTFHGRGGVSAFLLLGGDAPKNIVRLSLPVNGPSMEAPGLKDGSDAPPIDGDSFPSFVDWLLRRDRKRFSSLVDALRAHIPGLQDLLVGVPDPRTRRIDIEMEGGWQTPADNASAGTRMMMLFVAMGFHPNPPDLLLIEEPENGLHPHRLREVIDVLRQVSTRCQVVVTTHSPYLLDCIDASTDQILVFSRQEDGSCEAAPLDRDRIGVFLDEFGLGEVWSNEGEAGLT